MSLSRDKRSDQLSFDFSDAGLLRQCGALANEEGFALRYHIDDQEAANHFGRVLPSYLADFVDVAVAAHMADRLSSDASSSGSSVCRRRLPLRIPVREIDRWNDRQVRDRIEKVFQFLTGDDWIISFCRRTAPPRPAESQQFLFAQRPDGPVKVGLLSGGLDSFAGTAIELEASPDASFVCVSGVTNSRHESCQRWQVARLREYHGSRVIHVRVRCRLRNAANVRQDQTRRTRGFLFLTLGLVVACQAGAEHLSVYENGVGAVNLPYERGAVGAPNSRAVHPKTLRLVAELFKAVTGQQIQVKNPCLLRTKSQMCEDLPSELQQHIGGTFSCDNFGALRTSARQCGTCTSCLLRRAALHGAQLPDDGSAYLRDVRSADFSGKRCHTQGVDAMSWQVERILACLWRAEPWRALLQEFPELDLVAEELRRQKPRAEAKKKILALYERHCRDWRSFLPSNWLSSQGRAA